LFGHLTEHDFDPDRLFSDPRLLNQVLMVLTFSSDGKELLRRYVDRDFSRVHLSIRIRDAGSKPMGTTIAHIQKVASEAVKGWAKTFVTGELVVFSEQASEVVSSQVLSLILAFTSITIMMMIQLRSWVLGLLSLIPNLVPICVIFGMMGWLGITLDNVTVFAATVAIGLSVDDTIHFLTQLKRDIVSAKSGERNVETSLSRAYRNSAKALISTSIALFLGFLALSLTPTRPAVFFGFLGSAAIATALLGDLIFMPSIILSFRPIRRLVERTIVRQSHEDYAAVEGPPPAS
jgi:predicted RND superfamily exporter protein